ncbi:3809_t:CDS:2 [Ambispora leptoticha]|uniref:3809_t:CDS:1 n=1 Tax=Ambispora leptoticha TaxID=144679 RepID=A0A9N8ZBE6_9GLOM|nr:3809_t:CDS:2 [Ambispora leptoticha]
MQIIANGRTFQVRPLDENSEDEHFFNPRLGWTWVRYQNTNCIKQTIVLKTAGDHAEKILENYAIGNHCAKKMKCYAEKQVAEKLLKNV